jgi:hypothetical protein
MCVHVHAGVCERVKESGYERVLSRERGVKYKYE